MQAYQLDNPPVPMIFVYARRRGVSSVGDRLPAFVQYSLEARESCFSVVGTHIPQASRRSTVFSESSAAVLEPSSEEQY